MKYRGVEPVSPPNFMVYDRSPASDDYTIFSVGDLWLKKSTVILDDFEIWILTRKLAGVATWQQFLGSYKLFLSVVCDAGTALPTVGGDLSMLGSFITTTGAANNASLSFPDGTSGQLVVGGGGAGPAWASLTSTGATVAITTGANTLNVEVGAGVVIVEQFDGDSGSATPAAGVITVAGGTNLTTVGAASTLTINMDNDVSLSGFLDAANYVEGGNLRIATNTLSSQDTNGDINLIPDGTGSVVMNNGAADTFIMRSTGERSLPLQPAASWKNTNGPQEEDLGNGIAWTFECATERFDVGGDWDGLSTYTAPITGRYAVSYWLWSTGIDPTNTMSRYQVITSNRTYERWVNPTKGVHPPEKERIENTGFYLVDLDASDTITFTYTVYGASELVDVWGCKIMIYLVC